MLHSKFLANWRWFGFLILKIIFSWFLDLKHEVNFCSFLLGASLKSLLKLHVKVVKPNKLMVNYDKGICLYNFWVIIVFVVALNGCQECKQTTAFNACKNIPKFWPWDLNFERKKHHRHRVGLIKRLREQIVHEPSEENEMIRFLPPLQHHGGLFYGSMRPKYVDSGRWWLC